MESMEKNTFTDLLQIKKRKHTTTPNTAITKVTFGWINDHSYQGNQRSSLPHVQESYNLYIAHPRQSL